MPPISLHYLLSNKPIRNLAHLSASAMTTNVEDCNWHQVVEDLLSVLPELSLFDVHKFFS